jgi:Na+-transporting methylmalonyl-CoA/oxaloacetate decarboxylase gamma subunit
VALKSSAAAWVCKRHAVLFGALAIVFAFVGVVFKVMFLLILAVVCFGSALGGWTLRAKFQPDGGIE